jgi:ABC-type taurine transport system substrate-binding protein
MSQVSPESPPRKENANASRRSFLKFSIAAAVVAAAAIVGGVSYYDLSYLPSTASKTVAIADFSTAPGEAAIKSILQSQNLLSKYHLQANWSDYTSSATAMSAYAAAQGSVPFSFAGSILDAARLAGQGSPLQTILGGIAPTDSVVVSNSSGIKSLSDLQGKTIYSFTPQPPTLFVAAKTEGFNLATTKIATAAPPIMVQQLESGQIDVAYLLEPYLTELAQSNKTTVLTSFNQEWAKISNTQLPIVGILTCWNTFSKQFPNVVTNLTSAFIDAFTYLKANPSELDPLFTQAQVPSGLLSQAASNYVSNVPSYSWNSSMISEIDNFLNIMVEVGAIPSNPANMMTDSYIASGKSIT